MSACIADNHKWGTRASQRFSALIELKFVLSFGLDDHGLCDRDAFNFACRFENNSQAIASAMRSRTVQSEVCLSSRLDHPMERIWVRENERHFEPAIPELSGLRQLVRIRLDFTQQGQGGA